MRSRFGRGRCAAIVSIISRTIGVTWIGIRLRFRSSSIRASRAIVPSRWIIAPWPPGPRTVAFSQQICFSPSWIG